MTDLGAHLHNSYIADECSKILLQIYRDHKNVTAPVLAALGCGLLFNAVKNHPEFKGASNDRITDEMIRLVKGFLDTFQPNALN